MPYPSVPYVELPKHNCSIVDVRRVVGWGIGGIEAESVMLGRPIQMRMPEIVGAILGFHGDGASALPLADRATIANMAPEFGATAAMFAIDTHTLDFLHLTGRHPTQIRLVEAYARAQGLWAYDLRQAHYPRTLTFDLGGVGRALAGPSHAHQRIALHPLAAAGLARPVGLRDEPSAAEPGGPLPEGAVVIAAITSCTNTSNPRNMIAAGLAARKAVSLGLQRKPWVKTSFAPGSKAVEAYLRSAGLLAPLQQLGFGIVGFGCTSCNGISDPLDKNIDAEIVARQLHTVAVGCGNRRGAGAPCARRAVLQRLRCHVRQTRRHRRTDSGGSALRMARQQHLHSPSTLLAGFAQHKNQRPKHARHRRAGRQHHDRRPVPVRRDPAGKCLWAIPDGTRRGARRLQFPRNQARRPCDGTECDGGHRPAARAMGRHHRAVAIARRRKTDTARLVASSSLVSISGPAGWLI